MKKFNDCSIESVFVDRLPNPRTSHHSHATIAAGLVFVSGLVSQPNKDGTRPGVSQTNDDFVHDVSLQLTSIFEQLDAILEECNSRRELVLDVQVFLRDMKCNFVKMNASYQTFFGSHMPSRTTVEVVQFPSEVAIELKVIAAINQQENRRVIP